MATHSRKMHKEYFNDNDAHIDCEACLWPGIDFVTDAETKALEAFAAHRCKDWPNVFEIQGKLSGN